MKVKIRDDDSNGDVGTWTICFAIRPCSRRKPDEEQRDEASDQGEDGNEESER